MEDTFELELVEDSNHEEIKKKTFILSDTMETIQKTMMTEFNIAADVETRLWITQNNSSFGPFLADFWFCKKLQSFLWQLCVPMIIIEVMNEDGTWPRDVGYHRRSSSSFVTASTSTNKSVNEKMLIPQKDIVEIQDKLRRKKKELLDVKKSLVSVNQKQEELVKVKNKIKLINRCDEHADHALYF